ncbi:Random slug protein 5 [Fasciola hepatica]|uniref:Random slug protein 5 n=1 Tax=Fasciola hepatica TaxID=6192 RepID=A0A4E0R406_FASHE|nr:Random slug protein 5 [Fasciola hepatica]
MSRKGASGIHKKRKEVSPEEFADLINQLRTMVHEKCIPLPEEPEYATSEQTLRRFLKARKFVVNDAFKQLSGAIEWRRTYHPKRADCTYCLQTPGFHGIRQVGFDPEGRPVFYACFSQCQTLKNTAEDVIAHVVYLVENAMRCNEAGADQWIIIIDCTGLTLPCCNPKLGKQFSQVFGNCYPEHLARFFLVHHNPFFQGIWKAIRVFVDPVTVKKVKLVRKEKISKVFEESFDPELANWLKDELALNKTNITEAQRKFWEGPSHPGVHDPRGTASYVKKYIEPLQQKRELNPKELLSRTSLGQDKHLPHPNLLQYLNGQLGNVQLIDLKSRKDKPTKQELELYGVDPSDVSESTADAESEDSEC